MSVDGELHANLMAKVKLISDVTFLWPGKGGSEPSGEYVRVSHAPNDNQRTMQSSVAPLKRQGFLILVLCSPFGEHEAVLRERAGNIAGGLPIGTQVLLTTGSVEIVNYSIKPGRRENRHWETPIWIEYRGYA